MSKDPRQFPVRPVDDWIIVEKIHVKSIQEKSSSKLDLQMVGGMTAKNIMEIERQKAQEAATYELAEKEMLKMWDDHPSQGTVKAIGPGRSIEEGVVVPVPVKVGDHVYLRGRTGEPLITNGKLYWMHKPHEVFAVAVK